VSENRYWGEIRRAKPKLLTRRRILIVTEGEVTEPVYFHDLRQRVRTQLDIRVIGAGASPVTVVAEAVRIKKQDAQDAKRQRDAFIPYDEFWCVFDVDHHQDLKNAVNRARANKIGVALSNPCFELWILLHYQDQRTHIEGTNLKRLCREHIPGYEKTPPCELLYPNLNVAIVRAQLLERWQKESGRPNGNPSTDVHKLVVAIQRLAGQSIVSQLQKQRKQNG
jgi:hypothetical protein